MASSTISGSSAKLEPILAGTTAAGGPAGVLAVARLTDTLHLTVQHKPIFRLTCNEAYQYAHRGTVYPYALQVERLGGFDGPITLQMLFGVVMVSLSITVCTQADGSDHSRKARR